MNPVMVWPQRGIDLVTFEPEQHIGLQLIDIHGDRIFIPMDGVQVVRLAKNLSEMVARRPDVLQWKAPPMPTT